MMLKNALRLVLACGFGLAMLMTQQPLSAAGLVTFTVKVKSYPATARSTDGDWLLLALWGSAQAWVPAANGSVLGPVADLPTEVANVSAPAATTVPSLPATYGEVLPTVSARARAIYQLGL